ncbi:Acg family FMN-binding oxidoreductase [Streptomyces sp. CRN 30]|uniref:Acg family FMN-binding oxidoreductase n=1 Tax=Streptomyces sp. CRN 30 TaxID=3075613 RepID=UPI002A7F86AF|nr:hypothetical protein [Streptomyces sp. CRN 30]
MSPLVLDVRLLERLVAAAVAAPSLHNSQPWRFTVNVAERTVRLCAEPDRGLRHSDPTGRAVHVSAGCALLNLRIAAIRSGWEPVTRLLPCPDRPELLATVRLADALRSPAAPWLYEALWRRHSCRLPFSDRPLPAALRVELAEAAHVEGAALFLPGPEETGRLLRLTWDAERRNRLDADRATESRRWLREAGSSGRGIPPTAVGPQDFQDRLPMRDFGAHRRPAVLPATRFERRPQLALLTTAHDRRTDWLRAGAALERVLLVATAHDVRGSLLHQALEWDDLRHELGYVTGRAHDHAHMVIRLGYGPEGPATPRRGVHEAMTTCGDGCRAVPSEALPRGPAHRTDLRGHG